MPRVGTSKVKKNSNEISLAEEITEWDRQRWTIVTKISFQKKSTKETSRGSRTWTNDKRNINDIIIKAKMYYLRFIFHCAERKRWLRTLQFNGANFRWRFNKCILSVLLCYTSHIATKTHLNWWNDCRSVEIAVLTQFHVCLHYLQF